MIRKSRFCLFGKVGGYGKSEQNKVRPGSRRSGSFSLARLPAAPGDELLRRHARELFKDAVEVRQVAEAGLDRGEEDVVGLKHEPLRVIDAALGEVLRDGLARAPFELL